MLSYKIQPGEMYKIENRLCLVLKNKRNKIRVLFLDTNTWWEAPTEVIKAYLEERIC